MKPAAIAALVAGTLDLTLAIAFFAIQQGAPFTAVPHSVASALIGARAFTGGIPTAILGIALHYVVAFCIALFYYALSLRFGFLNQHPLLSGAAYGMGVFLFMQHVVLPLTARPPSHGYGTVWLLTNIASHIFFIGITIALITRAFSLKSSARART